MKPKISESMGKLLFLLPALVLFLLFFIYPVFFLGKYSFYEWSVPENAIFSGIENYKKVLGDKVFRLSIKNNIIWALVAGFIQVPLATLVALILSTKIKGWKFFRTIYFFPNVISGIALAMLWLAIFNNDNGALNALLDVLNLGLLKRNWLGTKETALPTILTYWVFYIGYFNVIIMAGISSIDESLYEAAQIDGANKIQTQISIVLPLIKTSIGTCVTLAMVNGLRQFEQVFLLTNGGPFNRTSVMVLYIYKKMNISAYGVASAASIVLILIGSVVIVCLNKLFKKD